MVPVSLCLSPSIGCFLEPLNPNVICPKTHYMEGHSWGLWGPSIGSTSGPCLKLFHFMFVLFINLYYLHNV